jgi:hypothetical protein
MVDLLVVIVAVLLIVPTRRFANIIAHWFLDQRCFMPDFALGEDKYPVTVEYHDRLMRKCDSVSNNHGVVDVLPLVYAPVVARETYHRMMVYPVEGAKCIFVFIAKREKSSITVQSLLGTILDLKPFRKSSEGKYGMHVHLAAETSQDGKTRPEKKLTLYYASHIADDADAMFKKWQEYKSMKNLYDYSQTIV